MADTISLAIVGAGNRGNVYARYAAKAGARIAAVAEPDAARRTRFTDLHPRAAPFDGWRSLAEAGRIADAVVIATLDTEHVEPALRFAELGYHILLEKPMAVRQEDCATIIEAAERAGVIFAVGHVMRYTPYTRTVLNALDRIGEIVSIEHLEPVGWWHQAHSFVRGNWRRTDETTFMLLAKSCHDLDWLTYVTGRPVERVASFGGLAHFRPENRPAGAADRCLDCAVEPDCPYSAPRLYLPLLASPRWPLTVITTDLTEDGVRLALREGPYGRCVYACDNDVVDHQVVNMEFAGGATASFTMTAFTPAGHRKSRIFGTRGSIEGNGESITVHDFVTGRSQVIDAGTPDEGHGGGDEGLTRAFLRAVTTGDRSHILSSPRESLHSHNIAWAAEHARRTGTVVTVS